MHGVIGQLGFLPEGPFEAVECTRPLDARITAPWPVTASSDAHQPGEVGCRWVDFEAHEAGFDGLVRALEEGRVVPRFGRG
jgi:hypothetical protein